MIHHPFEPDELDVRSDDLTSVARQLEDLAAAESGTPPMDLAARIHDRIADEPAPRRWSLGALFGGGGRANAFAVAAVAALAIVGAIAFGQLVGTLRQIDVGSSPSPSLVVPSPSLTPTPSSTPTPTPSPSAESPSPSASDDDETETPEPSETDDSGDGDDDNSGPGGGGDDRSGPGGG